MAEEIKEILENIKKQNEWEGVEYFRTPLSNEDADKLLNCITNLQQENKELKQTLHNISINGVEEENTTVLDLIKEHEITQEFKHYFIHEIKDLDNMTEKDYIKAVIDSIKTCYCNRTDCGGRIKDGKKYDSVYQEKEDYKSRCGKAKEYVNKMWLAKLTPDIVSKTKGDLLNILNGSDEK